MTPLPLTPQVVVLALCFLVGLGVVAYTLYVVARGFPGLYRAAIAAAPNPRRMRLLILVTWTASAVLGLTLVLYIFRAAGLAGILGRTLP